MVLCKKVTILLFFIIGIILISIYSNKNKLI